MFLVGIRRDLKQVFFKYPEKRFGPDRENPYVTVADAISDLPKVDMGEGGDMMPYQETKKYISENQKRFVSIMRGNYDFDGIHSS